MANPTSIKKSIMDMIKGKFGGLAIWKAIEANMAVLCADLPEMRNDKCRWEIIRGLNTIRNFLLERGIEELDLKFLEEEIESIGNTRQISLYVEEDDSIDDDTIKKYARLGAGTEGVVAIHLPYNYTQLSRLSNGVFAKTNLVKFYISRERNLYISNDISNIISWILSSPICSL